MDTVSERWGSAVSSQTKSKKNVKNPLTNPLERDTIRRSKGKSEYHHTDWEKFLWQSRGSEVPPHRLGKAKKKNVKNLLTNPLRCDTIRVQKERGGRSHKGDGSQEPGKTKTPMTRPHGVPVCGIQMWTRPRRLKKCRGYAGYTSHPFRTQRPGVLSSTDEWSRVPAY